MRDFTKMYRRARLAAALRGEGFMNYRTAELRLRRALIPVLASANRVAEAITRATLFATVFETAAR
jgi:hypothetical protein